ncbi:CoA-transferase [Rhizobium anhuiense]
MRVISSQQAADLLEDGMTVAASGFGGCCHPEAITAAVEERFLATGKPRKLTLLFAASTGDRQTRGMGHFGYEGLVARVIAGGWRGTPRLGRLAIEEKIEAHCWPQGVIAQLYRAIAAGQPGVITHIGLGSFMDPLHGGGRMNATTPRALVERVSLRGKEWLLYPSMPLDCVLLRGTTADEDGNVTLEDEAFPLDVLAMAQAGRNSGGVVIVQVKRIAERGSLPPGDVRIPAALVDYVVVCENPAQHGVSFAETDNIAYTGRVRMAVSRLHPAPLSADKIIQRRAFLELAPLHRPTINLGIGIAAGIGRIASEEGFDDYTVTMQTAGRVVYLGAFSAGGAEIAVADGSLDIIRDGRVCKIVDHVDQISSSPAFAPEGQSQLVVTERAVFRVIDGCLMLTEFAPGIDLASHVLDRLPKGVAVSGQLKQMDARLFATHAMKDFAP